MAGLKKFKIGGIDLKSNDLIRDPMKSSYLRNTLKNIKGDITGRPGYDDIETAAFELEEVVYHKSSNQDVFINSDGNLYKKYLTTRVICSIAGLFPNVGLTLKNRVVTDEYLSNMYLTTTDGNSDVIKFDGSDAYLAGLPAPTLKFDASDSDISTPGANYWYRFFYAFKDLNGNVTYGPFKELESTSTNATITVSTFKTANPLGKFYNKYLVTPILSSFTVNNSVPGTSNKFPYSRTNYKVGDELLIDEEVLYPAITVSSPGGRKSKALTITAISLTEITIDINDLSDFSFTVFSGPEVVLDTRLRLMVFRSTNASFGYKNVSVTVGDGLTNFALDNSQDNFSAVTSSPGDTLLEDIYNEAEQKLRPPKCKTLCAYGDQLIFANIIGLWNQINFFTQYNNDDLIIPSDFGIGDNGENHSANIQRIGESYDGAVNAIKRCNDLLVALKDNAVYALDGIIEPGGYSLRKIPTNYKGCINQNSVLQVTGGLFFQSDDGYYFTNGASCNKVSDEIDPFFVDIDASKTKATISRKFASFLFYMTNGTAQYCLIYMYEFKEWFIWDTLNQSKGLYERNNGDVVFANANVFYGFNTSYNDNGAAISHQQGTNWEDLREPSIDKKFKYIRIWNLNLVATSYKMRVQRNWTDTDLESVDVVIPAYDSVQKGFDQRNCKAIRFIFENTVVNENMLITGYELEYEATQRMDKGGNNGTN